MMAVHFQFVRSRKHCFVRGHKRCHGIRSATRARASPSDKELWVSTNKQETFTGCVEMGVQAFVLSDDYDSLAAKWKGLAAANIYKRTTDDSEELMSSVKGEKGDLIGTWARCASGEDLQALEKRANFDFGGTLVVAASDWSIIPAENLVAAFQNSETKLMMAAETAEEGRTLLGALEIGVDGVVMCTDNLPEIRSLHTHIEQHKRRAQCMDLEAATVTRVEPVGMGDRVCVDLCANMCPGEGMLVGNFCRSLFLVHSECAESAYINSRPFRVNAGPVHAYTAVSGGKTAYLAELKAGQEVERRPLVLVAAESSDGAEHSILLQNAETVKLVGPVDPEGATNSESDRRQWRTIAVTEIQPGDKVHVNRAEAGVGRHMGTAVQETLNEW